MKKKQEVEAELAAMFEEKQKETEEAKGYHK